MRYNSVSNTFSLAAILLMSPVLVSAGSGDMWSLCGPLQSGPAKPKWEDGEIDRETLQLTADEAELVQDGVSILRGDVQMRKGERQFQAGTVFYDQQAEVLEISDGVRLWDSDIYMSGSRANYDLSSDEGQIDDANYYLLDDHGRGGAGTIRLSSSDILQLEDVSYTTCNPGVEDWVLEADSINLDKVEDVGTARHVKVRFKDVPIFYSPYLTFPLSDKRKSGFLTPSVGSSNETGIDVEIPYYWNIAPERDATFGVRAMAKRGAMLQGEYRYLMRRGDGQLGIEYLPDDNEYDDSRALYSIQHEQTIAKYWQLYIDLNHVSDADYFEDLGTNLDISSTRYLNRQAHLSYSANRWYFLARAQRYQTVDDSIAKTSRPYYRLPQLLVRTSSTERNYSLNYALQAEYVHFDRSSGVTGKRLDFNPAISYPMRTPAMFLIPRLSLRHTRYSLDHTSPVDPSDPSRTVPTFSLDSGMFFERDTHIRGRGFVQTLEPRIYYLYASNKDQNDIPVFDTGEYTFSFAQLFRENRFSGGDRVGDASQATLALTSRLLEPESGIERMRFSVGQIRYFRDREVTLPWRVEDTRSASDIVGEVAAQITREWQAKAGLHWNPHEERTDKSTFWLRYQPDETKVVNLGYRYVRDSLEQTDISFRWPVNHRFNVVGRWNYALPESRILETFGGIEYENCCWALRAVARHYLNDNDGDHTNGIFLQLVLKGLAGVGHKTDSFLQRQIPGYENDF